MRHIRSGVLTFAALLMAVVPLAAQTGYVANSTSGGFVSFIDGNTNSILTGPILDVLVGHQPTYLVLSPDGTRLYVSNLTCNYPDTFQGCVSVIRTDALATSPTVNIPVGDFPRGIAITPDGTRLYVSTPISTIVSVLDTSTNAVINTIPLGNFNTPTDSALTPDAARLYLPNVQNTVSVIDTATNTLVATIPNIGCPGSAHMIAIAEVPRVPKSKSDCKGGGYLEFGLPAGPFRNQGQCIQYVETH